MNDCDDGDERSKFNNNENLMLLTDKNPDTKNKIIRSGLTAKKYKKQIDWRNTRSKNYI